MLKRIVLTGVMAIIAVYACGCQADGQKTVPPASGKQAIKWKLMDCQAVCPYCNVAVNAQTDRCAECKKEFVWKFPVFPNTPEGLMDKRRTAILYQDAELYFNCLVNADAGKMRSAIESGMGFPQMVPRDIALSEVSKTFEKNADNSMALVTFTRGDGTTKKLNLVVEDGVWKMYMMSMSR
ncbi:MAG: hypothetical protein HZA48_00340 [Planctomycetes bacterium]|nr:hypothetical protein [Planctomycetota bacterium]